MESLVKEFCSQHHLKPLKVEIKGKITIVTTEEGTFCLKSRDRSVNQDIYDYLTSRSFKYYPALLKESTDAVEVREYIEEIKIPREQKMVDLIELMSLLHNKTTHFREVDLDDYKEIYEDLKNNIMYLTSYYNDLISIVESHVIMSPKEYLLARNITRIFKSLYFCEVELEHWYELIKEKRKQRVVVLHNNLRLSHILRNEQSYFINWDKAKIGIPIFDFYKLYRRHALEFDFSDLLKHYEKCYPLKQEERLLLFILMSLPEKIELSHDEYQACEFINDEIDKLYKTEELILPYQSKKTKQHQE